MKELNCTAHINFNSTMIRCSYWAMAYISYCKKTRTTYIGRSYEVILWVRSRHEINLLSEYMAVLILNFWNILDRGKNTSGGGLDL
jgi:hypothetical protein